MLYLRILDAIRSITGTRSQHSFAAAPTQTLLIAGEEGGPATVLVLAADLAKGVLESPRYEPFNFLERILSVAREEKTGWIRRFCAEGLIMVEGPEHRSRRQAADTVLERAFAAVKEIPPEVVAATIRERLARPAPTAANVAADVVTVLMSRAVSGCTGRTVALPAAELFQIDFFNPFPSLSALARCNQAIGACCDCIGLDDLDAGCRATVLSMLIMGVRPLHAVVTALVNAWLEGVAAGESPEVLRGRLARIDSHGVVPVNFVMRRCISADTVGTQQVAAGDVLYLFLGSAAGCPFSRASSIPFGAGSHYCSGAQLSTLLLQLVRRALLEVEPTQAAVTVASAPVQGGAHAFLTFPLP